MAETPDDWNSAIDTTRPSIARAYDVVLHGKDNFEVDRPGVTRGLCRQRPHGAGPRAGSAGRERADRGGHVRPARPGGDPR
ncbi:SAM-dependent methyltransferase [Nonomuraea turkmeniaca]|uniref:SAM-dependent methyltransferase n=1 Tax=Nonomuraea turkmeniaca TaxID=103838 RepID=UPI001FE86DFA|nr:SAM-dependent methyltransferase [Nonomuraea turkmeniaca]